MLGSVEERRQVLVNVVVVDATHLGFLQGIVHVA
jgi:hypothetical protein